MTSLRRALIGLGVAAFTAGLLSALLIVTSDHGEQRGAEAVALLVIGWSFAGTGLYAWARRPSNRIGALMTAVGFAWFLQGLQGSDTPALFAAGFVLAPLVYIPLTQMLVSFPDGRLTTRLQRVAVILVVIDVTVFQWAAVPFIRPTDFEGCEDCPDNPLLVSASKSTVEAIASVQALVAIAALVTVIVVIVRRWRDASPAQRGPLGPVLVAGAMTLVAEIIVLSTDAAGVRHGIVQGIYFGALVILASVPFAFLFGLLRSRLSRAGAVSELVGRLGEGHESQPTLADALADALGDPTLELAYWLPDRERYVDGQGQTVELPQPGSGRAWTAVARDGEPLAAIVHDAALADEPALVDAVGAAAALALENERLDADLRARVEELSRSRRRLIEVGLAERRRLERNLHDGAQQRLVALALSLRMARGKLEEDPASAAGLLDEALGELDEATAELRELARGIHPAVLSDRGLPAALEALAGRAPVEVRVSETPPERLPAPVETAAYYVVAEALTNVAKYAEADRAEVRVTRDNGRVTVQVTDNGVGGADPAGGSGLRGLADRLAALDGRLEVESPAGEGTTIRAEIPCA